MSVKREREDRKHTGEQETDDDTTGKFKRRRASSPSCRSDGSTHSKEHPLLFSRGQTTTRPRRLCQERQASSAVTCDSAKSSWSMDPPRHFRKEASCRFDQHQEDSSEAPAVQPDQDLIFKALEDLVIAFVRSELKRIRIDLSPDIQEAAERQKQHKTAKETETADATEGILKVVLHFLRQMNQTALADSLEKSHLGELVVCQNKLKSNLKARFENVFEGIAKQGNPTLLNKIYTELHIVEGGSSEINTEHEVRQIEAASRRLRSQERSIKCDDIFEPLPGQQTHVRTVLTKGVAGIGKTVCTQKFALDWAEGKTNHRIQLIFSLPFRELNLMKGKILSLTEFLNHFFQVTKGMSDLSRFFSSSVLFIFDGLDECRLPLDFKNNEILCDVALPRSVDVLLTNLIIGKLLPSAQVWITSRPAAANQIPAVCVHRITEIRGFSDPQKEEYIQKKICDETLAGKIIDHVKRSRSLFIMCHIPVFSWISCTVLEKLLTQSDGGEIPKTLTQMYAHFLTFNILAKQEKYSRGPVDGVGADLQINTDQEVILKLGRLAYDQLEKGKIIFYEEDLQECGIDIKEASMYSGVCTQIFKEECGPFQDKVFCFVHLSIQEFLAALYVLHTFNHTNANVMVGHEDNKVHLTTEQAPVQHPQTALYRRAVDKALASENGHLDLFLRFLLGLSVQSHRTLVRGLLKQRGNNSQAATDETIVYIKDRIRHIPSPERCINLFYCLNELNDRSLVEEIQSYLKSGNLPESKLSPAQWSALVFVLLTSEGDLDVFDLKKYSRSDEGLLRLIPVIKASRTAQLSGCNLTERCCQVLAQTLSSAGSQLRELDLSDNDLQDAGIKILSTGIASANCKLEKLKLSFCGITEAGCASLAAALQSNPSHLAELDLTYNHPGACGVRLLATQLDDPRFKLKKLSVDHDAECWLKSGLKKYACELTLDVDSACRHLLLSDGNQKMTRGKEVQPYPDHPERFKNWGQMLCRQALTGRCYWEVEWTGTSAGLGVCYKGISRKGEGNDCVLGYNDQSWSLRIYDGSYNAWHKRKGDPITPPSLISSRVGVYLDWPAGTLSFYSVSSNTLSHLYTFQTSFSEPVYPGFRLWHDDTSVSLCRVE
ncbi:NLR family CARD domain-containing protein 3-like [Myripristis murdjan]|uniref:NLR family CARD domain-containing protein 3-like n=1 Tax=Myripristis murdjan TaxID=586833 RepID=UPI001175D2CC|nr:NLR family CARD domain-containing protein 3-like [Myripristis murdjan]XP_029937239.1 NLR family CARD domain-containing protein 3-like [Myripristis murdjan]